MIRPFLLAAAVAMAPIGAAQAATIVNGSFELGGYVDEGFGFDRVANGSAAITGWTVFGVDVDWIGSYWEAADGALSIDLDGSAGGGLKQVISDLVAGTRYVISFAMSGNPAGPPDDKLLTLVIGNDVGAFSYDVAANGTTLPSPMNWVYQTFSFVAQGTSAELAFISGNGSGYGPAIDDVRIAVAPIPVPAAFPLLLAGLGGLAMLRRRRPV